MTPMRAQQIAHEAHRGQLYGDSDYFSAHVCRVAYAVAHDERGSCNALVVAWLHDVLEDTDTTLSDLRANGLPPAAEKALLAVTRQVNEPYPEYIERVTSDRIASLVKYYDLLVNLEHCERGERFDRYTEALPAVEDALRGIRRCAACGERTLRLKTFISDRETLVNASSVTARYSEGDLLNLELGHEPHSLTCGKNVRRQIDERTA